MAPAPSWSRALAGFDDWQRMRGMGEKTRRAYGVDLGQLGEWASSHDLAPRELSHRELRRFAAVLGENGAAKSTVARKLAAIRTFYRYLLERGEVEANPADLVSSPKQDAYLPAVLKAGELAELLERIPGTTPLDVRDRAMFELAYAAGLRAEELVNLDVESVDPDAEEVRVEGKGSKTRVVPAGEHAWRALERYLDRARPALHVGESPALFLSKSGRRLSTSGRAPPAEAPGAPIGHLSAHPAPLLCHAPARGGRRPAHDPGTARPCLYQHDSDLHSGRVEAPQAGVLALSSARVNEGLTWRRTSRR